MTDGDLSDVGPVDPARGVDALRDLLADARDAGLFTGAAAVVGDAEGQTVVTVGTEAGAGSDPVSEQTRFDAASLTKPVVTTTVALRLVERGRLRLDDTLGQHVPPLEGTPRGEIPIRSLLTHTSGLPPYKSFPFGWDSRESLLESLYRSHLSLLADPGEWFVYSDLNFVHLADALRRVTGATLADLAAAHLLDPVGATDSAMGPLDAGQGVAATRDYRWRERVLRGEIHDYIGAAAEGESGNAGLFATAPDLASVARTLLSGGRSPASAEAGADRLFAPATVSRLRRDAVPWADRPHGLGWRLAGRETPAPQWSDSSFGHTGFTGCSVWIDPERGLFAVLLTNRLLAREDPEPFGTVRSRFHAVAASLPRETLYDAHEP
jgi:CubicO group peptidase (beta-lactamase class C family)